MLCIANRNQGILIREGRFRISPAKGESKVGLMMLGKGRGEGGRQAWRSFFMLLCINIFIWCKSNSLSHLVCNHFLAGHT